MYSADADFFGRGRELLLQFLSRFTSMQHAKSTSSTNLLNLTCCHTEVEDEDQTCYLTESQYTDPRPTIPKADFLTPLKYQFFKSLV